MVVSSTIAHDTAAWARRLATRDVVRLSLTPEVAAAAVLVPIVEVESEARLLFTERSNSVSDHKGQISFPGGRVEAGDADAQATALREAEEEIGVARSSVQVLGALDDTVTITGFRISPIVGLLPDAGPWRWNEDEIQSVFTLPISQLMAPRTFDPTAMTIQMESGPLTLPAFVVGHHRIWGATCRIVLDFLDVVLGWRPPLS